MKQPEAKTFVLFKTGQARAVNRPMQVGGHVTRHQSATQRSLASRIQAAYDILVVEDDVGIRSMIEEVLVEEGYRVQTAQHGREALLMLADAHPRLILLDIMMPVMDGKAFYQQLQADAHLCNIPVIAMSAAHNLQLLSGAPQVVGLLPKPFMLSRLLQLIASQITP